MLSLRPHRKCQTHIPTDISLEEAQWILGSFCTLHRLNFDPALFAQRYPPPLSIEQLGQVASELGLQFERRPCGIDTALAWRLPLLLCLEAAPVATESSANPQSASHSWALILNADETRVVLIEHGMTSPVAVELADLKDRYLGSAFSLTPKLGEAIDPDGIEHRQARFGLHWFVPELLKHRTVWRDVLTASLVLQLMGLALPLFTQVIIDKVVVHRTKSTLIALGIAMAVFMLFNSGLSWVRQYLILHTGQRIDAILASQVFDKLFRLPLLYFQHRPTGVISARLQGIETIREFIASAAVTVALDLPFLLIFVAIMFWYSVPLTLLVLGILALVTGMSFIVARCFASGSTSSSAEARPIRRF